MRDWLRRQGRLAWLLVIIPVVAAIAGVGIGMARHPGHTATATVTVSAADGSTSGASLTSATSTFVGAIHDNSVVQQAAQASGVPAGDIESQTSASRIGDTQQVTLKYSGNRRGETVTTLLTAQAKAAAGVIYGSAQRTAQSRVDHAQARINAANAQLDALRKAAAVSDPGEAYRLKSNEVTSLRVALVTAQARGEYTAPIQAALDAATAEMNHYSALEVQFAGPQSALSQAREALDAARTQQDQLGSQLDAATGGEAIEISQVKAVPKLTAALRLGVTAAVIGFVLAAALLVGSALLRRDGMPAVVAVRRRREMGEPAEGRA